MTTNITAERYSTVAIWLHWLIALALAFQIALGFTMPDGAAGFGLFQLHKSIGITILLLSLLRLGWRLTHRPPPAAETGWGGRLAKAVHVLLYVFMIGAPLSGWALVSTSRFDIPTLLYGIIPWPHLPLPQSINEATEGAHEALAFMGLALIVLHVAGALRHQFLIKDGLLGRIGPGGSAGLAGLLGLGVFALYFGAGGYLANKYMEPEEAAPAVEEAGGVEEPAPIDEPIVEETPEPEPTETQPAEEEPVAEPEVEETTASVAEPVAAKTAGPPPVWTIQPGKRLAFSAAYGDDSYDGTFADWSGDISFDPDNPENAKIAIRVNLASAALGDATQDNMLRGAEFFAASANPTATWRSTSVSKTGANSYAANGTLSLKGVSKPQRLNFTLSGSGMRRAVTGTATISRGAFGIGGASAADIADGVALSFRFDATGRQP